jgi:hypothetical protein
LPSSAYRFFFGHRPLNRPGVDGESELLSQPLGERTGAYGLARDQMPFDECPRFPL